MTKAKPLAPAFALPEGAQLLHGTLADGTRVYLIDAPMYAHGANPYIGADGLAHLCKEMVKLGRTDCTEGASDMLTDMEQEFQAVRHSLSALLEKET